MSFVFLPEDSTGKTDAENSFQFKNKNKKKRVNGCRSGVL